MCFQIARNNSTRALGVWCKPHNQGFTVVLREIVSTNIVESAEHTMKKELV